MYVYIYYIRIFTSWLKHSRDLSLFDDAHSYPVRKKPPLGYIECSATATMTPNPRKGGYDRFNDARFMTSIYLSTAFHQIKSNEASRKYTAFLFDSTVYQYMRTSYGFRNSLSVFITVSKLVLRKGTGSFVVFYMGDLLFSPTFEDHLPHIDIVISKLINDKFTINAAKCRTEIKFYVRHRIKCHR
jgi:hypothetical protein